MDAGRVEGRTPVGRSVRQYDDPCGIARALNVIGDRWALLIVRELLLGPKRFSDLQFGLNAISANVLSLRLADLEASGIVRKHRLGSGRTAGYELTERGRELRPVLLSLATWGAPLPMTSSHELTADALVLALQTTVDPEGPRVTGVFELWVGPDVITLHVDGHEISAARGPTPSPTASLTADPRTLRSVLSGRLPVEEAVSTGRLRIDGDAPTARALLGMFRTPW
jgi:DNA-binding HxlR family transcriptional regulator